MGEDWEDEPILSGEADQAIRMGGTIAVVAIAGILLAWALLR